MSDCRAEKNAKKRPPWFVYAIESPAPADLLDGRTEGRVLAEALDLAKIPWWYSLAVDRESLRKSLGQRLEAAVRHHDLLPILHLSMHGNEEGVALTSGDRLSWHDLRTLLLPLNRVMRGGLLICMSSCFGSNGCRMAMSIDSEPNFGALVGNKGSATWDDAAVAYICFYHLLFKGSLIDACVEAMGQASGDHNFCYHLGTEIKASWDKAFQENLPEIGETFLRQVGFSFPPEGNGA